MSKKQQCILFAKSMSKSSNEYGRYKYVKKAAVITADISMSKSGNILYIKNDNENDR
jgi:hypothetical protein